jgi:hypothetical protein
VEPGSAADGSFASRVAKMTAQQERVAKGDHLLLF